MPPRKKPPARPKRVTSKKKAKKKQADFSAIRIRGARQNNLQGVDVDIPINELTVITGPSGSGKSSLAFQTIYAEGQRRYVETFSPYTRQFFDRMDKPLVDSIEGIPPAIAIEQVNNVKTTRSTVGSITEVNDYLKLYFPKVAQAHCPSCDANVEPDNPTTIARQIKRRFDRKRILITFGVPVPEKTKPGPFFEFLQGQGYVRVRLFGKDYRTDEPETYKKRTLPAIVDVIQDRLRVDKDQSGRLLEAIEAANRFGKGKLQAIDADAPRQNQSFSSGWHCAPCDESIRPPSPGLFNFNHPLGACPSCKGFGRTIGIDLEKAIPDPGVSLLDEAIVAFKGSNYQECQLDLIREARRHKIDVEIPFEDLPKKHQDWVLFGDQGKHGDPEDAWQRGDWYGVQGFFDWIEKKIYKMHVRVFLSRFRSYTTCRACCGDRLQPEALQFRYKGHTLPQLWQMPVEEITRFFNEHPPNATDPSAELLYEQITNRLQYLGHVGLHYLTLDRATRTLSGGELQRVNLTTCLGASLVNTLFVLDEPSIGLHPRDIGRLTGVMRGLRDKGNTLVVVEHEEAIIRTADYLIDIGPGRGLQGGELVYAGPAQADGPERSLTFDYLTGRKTIPVPEKRRRVKKSAAIVVQGARQHNLQNVSVTFPLGVFCAITGVSGSGKSTLVHHVLYRNIVRQLGETTDDPPGRVKNIRIVGGLDEVIMVDQSPLSRTPRSTPAVYLGVFDLIRKLFAATEEAKAKKLTMGYFSFNSGAGRCERCWGSGYEKVEMQFLSDLFVKCPECEGRRYQPEALKTTLLGQSVADVLEMTVDQAATFFQTMEAKMAQKIVAALQVLIDVGLGYLPMGRPLNTLSGGEAQRLKLVGHLLSKESQGKHALLIFDEPTTGLHFDDVARLLQVMQRLVDAGHSIMVIEHHMDVIKCADHVIDLGPEAGKHGGVLVAEGTPEEVARVTASHTGRYLAKEFGSDRVAEEAVAYQVVSRAAKPKDDKICIHGARENNLKNLQLELPRNQLVVITGLSGSGKSTLAFDILFAEGQRRFLDSMSPYARQFTQQMEKAEVDLIEGLPPTVAIEQRISRGGGKSTVATVTEIYHFLRLLYSKVGVQQCPECEVPVEKQSGSAIATTVVNAAKKDNVRLLAPVIKARKGFHKEVAEWAGKHGYDTLLVDGEYKAVEGFQKLARFKEHTIDVVIADLDKKTVAELGGEELRAKIDTALNIGKGTAKLALAKGKFQVLSSEMTCPECSCAFEELDPRLFSYNSPHGWCRTCRGYGQVEKRTAFHGPEHGESVLEAELQEEMRRARASKEDMMPCPDCEGTRLNPIARNVLVQGTPIEDITEAAVQDAAKALGHLCFKGRDAIVAKDVLREVIQRLLFLDQVGLGYLGLNRSATTLSGGEAQRIRLASQLGSNLRGVLYVLDEPTIGLHQRDNVKLLDTLENLRDQGNSLVVVEHDDETMRRSNQIIDLGPGAGKFGGEVIAQGALAEVKKLKHSVTGQALRDPMTHPSREKRRPIPAKGKAGEWITVKGAETNNLHGIDIAIPLGRLVCMSGVSGSGKSSFMRGVLRPAVESKIEKKGNAKKTSTAPKTWKSVTGVNGIAAVYEVDQSPIGKTSRSTPATYVKVFDEIRKLFSGVPTARMRGYTASRFSFNTKQGRCESCEGHGQIKMEMTFLPTSYVRCEDCQGLRYNAATLEVLYHEKNIGEVMQMTIDDAEAFFATNPKIHRSLKLLKETGTGYLQLGQPSPTLSGGEAQRIKLVTQLTKGVARSENAKLKQVGGSRKTNLYLIEEPSIGLHLQDVRKLVDVLHQLVDDGHTVVVIEHNMDILAEADYLIDMGPEAGADGGTIVAQGTPEQVAKSKTSRSAPYLEEVLV